MVKLVRTVITHEVLVSTDASSILLSWQSAKDNLVVCAINFILLVKRGGAVTRKKLQKTKKLAC
jgi:hypothetical protein